MQGQTVRAILIGAVIGTMIALASVAGTGTPFCNGQPSPPAPQCGGMGACYSNQNACTGIYGNGQYCCTQVTYGVCYEVFGYWQCCGTPQAWVQVCLDLGDDHDTCNGTAQGCDK